VTSMYESRTQAPINRRLFIARLFQHAGLALVLLVVSLGMGMCGYMFLEELPPVDAFLNSAMLLGGMGPVDPPHTWGGKVFAGSYALYAGLVFIVSAALIFTPVVHRVLHKFHWDAE
jgi:hypothetical protein